MRDIYIYNVYIYIHFTNEKIESKRGYANSYVVEPGLNVGGLISESIVLTTMYMAPLFFFPDFILLYNTVLVLPHINMNPPRVYGSPFVDYLVCRL